MVNDIYEGAKEKISKHVILFTTFLAKLKVLAPGDMSVLRKDEHVYAYDPLEMPEADYA